MIIWWDIVEKYESELEKWEKKQTKQANEDDDVVQSEQKNRVKKVKKVRKNLTLIFIQNKGKKSQAVDVEDEKKVVGHV